MRQPDGPEGTALQLRVGGSTRSELRSALSAEGVLLNAHAETLLDHRVFERRDPEEIAVVERTLRDLGLHAGGTLVEVFAAAGDQGFSLCPPDTGPYFRLARMSQGDAPDSVLSAGRSPSGAIKVASQPLSDDTGFPKGFYLRVVDGRRWLRGFRCDDQYRFSLDDRFAFTVKTPSGVAG